MKKLLSITILLVIGFCAVATARHNKNPLMASDTVVWAGLDYSMVRMIGTNDFQIPDMIFPGMLEKWNQLFLDERIESLAKTLRKNVAIDIGAVSDRNKTATAAQIILTADSKDVVKESHISQQDIAAEVQFYKLSKTSGLGLVFIVDRFVHRVVCPPSRLAAHDRVGLNRARDEEYSSCGAVYVVFFDVATREIISSDRDLSCINTGANFRNFWFGVIKNADKNLDKYR
ncbi:MAG: hypothetical protein WCS70_07080 [Verrucomicrobiota bacterium]